MEDLRVLEQQQQDSQRHLSAAKLAKQQRLEQRSQAETRLSRLKFSNGELRADLQQCRDVLSRSTRDLNSARLRADRGGGALRAYGARLEASLGTVRNLQFQRRRIDTAIAGLRSDEAGIERSRDDAEKVLRSSGLRLEDARRREGLLLRSASDVKRRAGIISEETAGVRANLLGLEQDLAAAQQMEAETRFRCRGVKADVESERRRAGGRREELGGKIADARRRREEMIDRAMILRTAVGVKMGQLRDKWEECVRVQEEEGHDISPEPNSDGGEALPPSLDVSRIRARHERAGKALREDREDLKGRAER